MQTTNLQGSASNRGDMISKIVDHPHLNRVGAAVINTEESAYQAAKARALSRRQREERIKALETQVRDQAERLSRLEEKIECLLQTAKN